MSLVVALGFLLAGAASDRPCHAVGCSIRVAWAGIVWNAATNSVVSRAEARGRRLRPPFVRPGS